MPPAERRRAPRPARVEERVVLGEDARILAGGPLLFDRRALARALGVSLRHVDGMRSRGLVPTPVRLGAAVRWDAAEITRWIAAGCPARDRWEALRGTKGGRP